MTARSGPVIVLVKSLLTLMYGVPILLVTHDPRILDIADRIVSMEDGRIADSSKAA